MNILNQDTISNARGIYTYLEIRRNGENSIYVSLSITKSLENDFRREKGLFTREWEHQMFSSWYVGIPVVNNSALLPGCYSYVFTSYRTLFGEIFMNHFLKLKQTISR